MLTSTLLPLHYLAWRTASHTVFSCVPGTAGCLWTIHAPLLWTEGYCWEAAARPGHTFPALHPHVQEGATQMSCSYGMWERITLLLGSSTQPPAWFSARFLSLLLAAYLHVEYSRVSACMWVWMTAGGEPWPPARLPTGYHMNEK